jgi:2',3'-cyclic-nucleotide 2'-phosphodiesterase (5'-nucleotidase family)
LVAFFWMVKLKKYPRAVKQFGLFLTFLLLISCGSKNYHVNRIEGREIGVTENGGTKAEVEDLIKPYRDNIDKDMNVVLAYAPQTLDKSGQWQTTIGNMMADASLDLANRIFTKRENKTIDMCILNFGGIRSIIPPGNVTTRTAFEVMPFENKLIVAELKGEQILEIITYIIKEKKAHPISGLAFTISKNDVATNMTINGKAIELNKSYFVVTSDYLINGGDKMDFFKAAINTYDLDYKLRNVLIDYFKEIDTLPVKNDIRIKISD